MAFDVNPAGMGDEARATLLNRYRFLKALELSFGLFSLAYWREIFGELRALGVFLVGLAAGVAARAGSRLVDGTPRTVFLVFMALELVTGMLVWYVARPRRTA